MGNRVTLLGIGVYGEHIILRKMVKRKNGNDFSDNFFIGEIFAFSRSVQFRGGCGAAAAVVVRPVMTELA